MTSPDPNASEVVARREREVRAARAEPVEDRALYLCDLVRGKRLLDVGVVDHFTDSGQQLHRRLARVAAESLGIDVLRDGIEALRRDGFDARVCDITRDSVEGQFDVIVAGEVIEHLGSPEAVFRLGQRNLVRGGCLVLTTPNPYYVSRIRDALLGRSRENVDHVSLWSPSGIAEMADRHELRLERYRGVSTTQARTVLGKVILALRPLANVLPAGADAWCNALVFECVKPK